MIRKIAVFLLSVIFLTVTSCTTVNPSEQLLEGDEPVEYSEDEFPNWLNQLRRAEILFAGSIPFTILLANAGYGLYGIIESGIVESYSIEDFTESSGLTDDERYDILKISLSLSGAIALADFVIGFFDSTDENE